jgi:hypothetical protein
MEAAAAVGVAAAAVQFLDFSVKTLALCREIRDSSTGSTKTNDELTKSIKKLTAMQKDLRQSGSTPSSTYRQLIRAVQDCSTVASELLKLLEDIREAAKKSLGTMRSALKAMKERKTIEKLQARLTDCQVKYHMALTTDMRDEILRRLEEQDKNTDSIRDIILQQLNKARSESEASHSVTHDKLQTLGEDLNWSASKVQQELSALRIGQQSSSKTLRTGQRSLGKSIDGQFQKLSTSETQQKFLDILYFPEMFARQESMKRRCPGTYNWVFDGRLARSNDKDKELRGRISCWLRNTDENPLFWISGKPGSGKSSLLSFIMGDPRTEECMRVWAGGRSPHIFSFFFWKPGSSLQRTMLGLRRSLLWQLCRATPEVIEKLLSKDPTLLYSPCTDEKLTIALDLALSLYRDESVLFIIDGLDECEGNHNDLLDEFHGMRLGQRNKMCLSSRPEEALRRRLEPLPSVRLQDLNHDDIFEYAHAKLRIGGDPGLKFASQVAQNAEGVFLWAVLVCDSLSAGVMAKDGEDTMLRRLYTYPRGLDDLFHRMFSDVEELHHKSVALYFYAARQFQFSVALAAASQLPRNVMTIVEFGDLCEREVTRIIAQSKGLLQIDDTRSYPDRIVWTRGWTLRDTTNTHIRKYPLKDRDLQVLKKYVTTNITFVHRSAHDYILGVARNERPAWLRPVGGPEMIRDIVDGALWFAQYRPTIIATSAEMTIRQDNVLRTVRSQYSIAFDFQAIATDDFSKLDRERLYEGLDKYLDTTHKWISIQKSDPKRSLAKYLVASDSPVALTTPRKFFWKGIMRFEPRFLTSRLHRFWDCEDAYFETIALLEALLDTSRSSSPTEVHRALLSALTEFRIKGRASSSIADFPYTGQRRYCYMYTTSHGFFSWLGTGIREEPSIIGILHSVATFGNRMRESDPEAYDLRLLLHAISETWEFFVGRVAYMQRDASVALVPSPLQLSLPLYYKHLAELVFPMTDESTMNNSTSSHETGLKIRLSCFARHGTGRFDMRRDPRHMGRSQSAIETYNLSLTATTILLKFCMDNYRDLSRAATNFVGTSAELSLCQNAVLADLWEDPETQLTAWGQLYVRAYVKRYFVWCWKLNDKPPKEGDLNGGA